MATTIAQKFAALGTSIINLVATRATVNMDNLTTAGINKIAEYGGGGGVAKTAMSNVLLSVASASSSVSGTAPDYTVKVSGTFKGMIPNGRYSADGTLKSTETTVTLSNTTVYTSRTKVLYAWGSDSSIRIYADVATLTEDSPLFTSDGNHYEGDAKYVIDAANNQIQYTSADGSTTSTLSYYEPGNGRVSADKGDVLYVFTDASGNIDCHPYTISFNQPAGAGNDDVWYDMKNNYLKRYSSSQSQWNTYSAFLIAELHVDYHGEPICHLEEPVQILDGGVLIDKIEEAQVPTGTVIAYMGTDVPEGFMQMDGRTLSRNTYAKLFSVIGTTQGAGDGSTTFQIADMTDGRYLMGSTVAGSSREEVAWSMPVFSSYTYVEPEGDITISASSEYSSNPAYYPISGSSTCWAASTAPGWWKLQLPYDIVVMGLSFINVTYSSHLRNWVGRFYTTVAKTTPIGDEINMPNTNGYNYIVSGIPANGIVTNMLYLYITSMGFAGGMRSLVINATKLEGARPIDHLWSSPTAHEYFIKY